MKSHIGIGLWIAAQLLSVVWMAQAQAQLGVPSQPLPNLPQLPGRTLNNVSRQLDSAVRNTGQQLDVTLQNARNVRVGALLREHPEILEADPRGAPLLRAQIVAISPQPQALQRALSQGYTLLQDQDLPELNLEQGLRLVTLQAPAGMSTRRALQQLRQWDRDGSYDYNHVYLESGAVSTTVNTSASSSITGNSSTRIGLVDGGVMASHPAFSATRIQQWGCAQPLPSAHGTAVASLMVGQAEHFFGTAPGAQLFAADVYCGLPQGGSMARIVSALSWLAQHSVPVINLSLVGPDNVLLKQVVANLLARGFILVAAVGNDGPAAPPLYPAAYPGVVGVTAVDKHNRILLEAVRGKQVRFAAPGADLLAADMQGGFSAVRGTSFAAPLVAGLLALKMSDINPLAAQHAIEELQQQAHDLGPKGVDTQYGYGMVGESLR